MQGDLYWISIVFPFFSPSVLCSLVPLSPWWRLVFMRAGTYPSASIWDYTSAPSHGLNGRLEPPLYTACRLVEITSCWHWQFVRFSKRVRVVGMHRLKDDELAELLIRAGADLNGLDFYGHTPLWYVILLLLLLAIFVDCNTNKVQLKLTAFIPTHTLYDVVGWQLKDKGRYSLPNCWLPDRESVPRWKMNTRGASALCI